MLSDKINFHPDQFGFYTVGDTYKTYSKLEAILEMRRSGIHLDWNFNREIFSSYDWTKEPQISLNELYRQRAQQIRNSYDYVVIFYSGGADSWNILNTFLSNDIQVDEIAHCWSLKGDNDYFSYFNEEIYKVAIPTTLKIQENHPDIKHRIIDITDMVNDTYSTPEQGFDFIYYTNNLITPNGLARSYLREKIDDYRRLIDAGKRVVFVWGTEKPRLTLHDGRYHCFFLDMFDNAVSSRIQWLSNDKGYFDELFYWSPDAAPLIIKQCHVLKKFLDRAGPDHPWIDTSTTDFGQLRNHPAYITADGLHSLIYPGWDISTFTNGKNKCNVIGPRDRWFWKQKEHANPSLKRFKMGVEKLHSTLDHQWFKNINDWNLGIKSCINEYAIEP